MLSPTIERAEWLEQRRQCVTATDIAAILNAHPYKTPRQVYLDKLGLLPEVTDSDAMYWGNSLEESIARRYAEIEGVTFERAGFVRDPLEPFGATPDFYIDRQGVREVLECKVAGLGAAQNFGVSETDQVPDHYLCQVMWQLSLTGLATGRLAVLMPNRMQMKTYTIKRDEDLIRVMRMRARLFWNEYVLQEREPPLVGTKGELEQLDAEFPAEVPGKEISSTEEVDDFVRELRDVRLKLAELETEEMRLESEIKKFMGDAERMTTAHGPFTWKTPQGGYIGWKQIAEQLVARHAVPAAILLDLKARYTTRSRRFNTPFRSNKA